MIPAALHYPVTASANIVAGRALLRGLNATGTVGGGGGTFTVYDSAKSSTSRVVVPTVTLADAANFGLSLGSGPVAVEQGLYVAITGAVTLAIYANPETRLLHALGMFDDGTTDLTELGIVRLAAEIGFLE